MGASRLPVFPAPSFIREGKATKQSSGEMRREDAKVCPQLECKWRERRCRPHSVIASAAKQSRFFPRWQSGLLRCARNDGGDAAERTISLPSSWLNRLCE